MMFNPIKTFYYDSSVAMRSYAKTVEYVWGFDYARPYYAAADRLLQLFEDTPTWT